MKGILFKPWKIAYIAEHPDIEIQTRRLGGLKLLNDHEPDCWELSAANNDKPPFRFRDKRENIPHNERYFPIECKPRYQQGETVYIKEAWSVSDGTHNQYYIYKADGQPHPDVVDSIGHRSKGRWRSPMMMPEWAARYFITITDVRAERLRDIKPIDILREGITISGINPEADIKYRAALYDDFKVLWNSINKDYPWESNPWVCVYTFRRRK